MQAGSQLQLIEKKSLTRHWNPRAFENLRDSGAGRLFERREVVGEIKAGLTVHPYLRAELLVSGLILEAILVDFQ